MTIYSLYYLYFLLYLLISILLFFMFYFFFCTVFLTQCVSLFVGKRRLVSLLSHNLTFSCPRSQGKDPARDSITHDIKAYAYNNWTGLAYWLPLFDACVVQTLIAS